MATTAYQDILDRVEHLAPDDQLRLMEQLATLLRRHTATQIKHSVMELQGLGKEIWQGVDAQEYVDEERDAWNG